MTLISQVRAEANVPREWTLVYTEGPYSQSMEAIRDVGGQLASPGQVALGAMQPQASWTLRGTGSVVEGAIVYSFDQKPLLVRYSPLHDLEENIAHRNQGEFFLDRRVFDEINRDAETDSSKEPEQRDVLRLTRETSYAIPVQQFCFEELTRFLFGRQAPEYGSWLESNGVQEMNVNLEDPDYVLNQRPRGERIVPLLDKLPFLRQLIFRPRGGRCAIGGCTPYQLSHPRIGFRGIVVGQSGAFSS